MLRVVSRDDLTDPHVCRKDISDPYLAVSVAFISAENTAKGEVLLVMPVLHSSSPAHVA